MAVLKTAGRADIAAAYKALATAQRFMIAVGPGEEWWGTPQVVLHAFAGDDGNGNPVIQLNPAHAPVSAVTVRSADGQTLYAIGTDYVVDPATGRITHVFGGNIAPDASAQVTYTAAVPQPDRTTGALVTETGRVAVGSIQYVMPFDEVGDEHASFVIVDSIKYALVEGPASSLLFTAHLAPGDGVGALIREYALFSRAVVDPDLPPGQSYFEPHQIVDPGVMVLSRFRAPVPHDGTVGLDLSIVIEI